MNGFNVLSYGATIICQTSGRNDVQIWIVNEKERGQLRTPPGTLILFLAGENVHAVQAAGSIKQDGLDGPARVLPTIRIAEARVLCGQLADSFTIRTFVRLLIF